MKTYLRRNQAEVLLCEEQIADDPELAGLCRKFYYLSAVCPPDSRSNAISKYQSAEAVIKCLNRKEPTIGETVAAAQPVRILGITCISDDGRASRYAWNQAVLLAKKQRVLFLGLSPLFRPIGNRDTVFGMSEMIYRLKQAVELKMDDITESILGVDCIYGYSFWSDTEELGEPEAKRILTWLREKSGYENIILDLSGQHKATAALLAGCDRVEAILEDNETERYTEYQRQLEFAGFTGLTEHFIRVQG